MKLKIGIACLCIGNMAFQITQIVGMGIVEKIGKQETFYQQAEKAIKENDPDRLLKLLSTYKPRHTVSINEEEEFISQHEIEQATSISLQDMKFMVFRNGKNPDPQLINLIKLSDEVIEERKKEARKGITKILDWPTKSLFLIGTGGLFALLGVLKVASDAASYFDKTNSGWNLVAQILGDLVIISGSGLPLYEGLTNKPAHDAKAKACETRVLLEDKLLEKSTETKNEKDEEEID